MVAIGKRGDEEINYVLMFLIAIGAGIIAGGLILLFNGGFSGFSDQFLRWSRFG